MRQLTESPLLLTHYTRAKWICFNDAGIDRLQADPLDWIPTRRKVSQIPSMKHLGFPTAEVPISFTYFRRDRVESPTSETHS